MKKHFLRNNEGTIVRPIGRPVSGFSVVPDSILLDRKLSANCRLILSYITGKPPGWVACVSDICRQLGITDQQWRTAKRQLKDAGIIPADHPKRLGGGVNKFTWVLDILLERYWQLSTDHPAKATDGKVKSHPPKSTDGSHPLISMCGKVQDNQQELTNKKKPPPTRAGAGAREEVVVFLLTEKEEEAVGSGLDDHEKARVASHLAGASEEQRALFFEVLKERRGAARDFASLTIGLAKLAGQGQLSPPRGPAPTLAGLTVESPANVCARAAQAFGKGLLAGPDGPVARAVCDPGHLLHSPSGGVFPLAQSCALWKKVESGELSFSQSN